MASVSKNSDGSTTRTYSNGKTLTISKSGQITGFSSGNSSSPSSSSTSGSKSSSSSTNTGQAASNAAALVAALDSAASNSTSSSSGSKSKSSLSSSSLSWMTPSSSSNSVTQTSQPSSKNSITTSSSGGSLTVQPTYISAGKGGVSYDITYADGTQNGIAVSGISTAEAAQYYLQKAAQAEAKGDTEKAAKWYKAAGDFGAASAYESATGILDTYGTKTGVTYDATGALQYDAAKGQTYIDPALVVQYNSSYNSESADKYYGPLTISTNQGATTLTNSSDKTAKEQSIAERVNALLSPVSGSGTNTTIGSSDISSINTDMTYPSLFDAWDSSKGIIENIQAYGAMVEPSYEKSVLDHQENVKSNGFLSAFTDEAAGMVDRYSVWSEESLVSSNPGNQALGMVNTVAYPSDMIRVGNMISEGRIGEVTAEDWAFVGLDAFSLVPVVGWAAKAAALSKLGKLGKGTKVTDALADTSKLTKSEGAAENVLKVDKGLVEDGEKFSKVSDIGDDAAKLSPNKVADNVKSPALKTADKIDNVTSKLGTASLIGQAGILGVTAVGGLVTGFLGDEDSNNGNQNNNGSGLPDSPYQPRTETPIEQGGNPNDQNLIDALQAALSGGVTAGGAGGGGDITIVNEIPESSSSSSGASVSEILEQVKPFIIPAIAAVVIIALLKLSSNKNKSRSSA